MTHRSEQLLCHYLAGSTTHNTPPRSKNKARRRQSVRCKNLIRSDSPVTFGMEIKTHLSPESFHLLHEPNNIA